MPKTGFYKYRTEGNVFSYILSYTISLRSFIAVFPESSLCKIFIYLLILMDESVFKTSSVGKKFLIVYDTI